MVFYTHMDAKIKHALLSYKSEVEVELTSILDWWMEHMINKETGFFLRRNK